MKSLNNPDISINSGMSIYLEKELPFQCDKYLLVPSDMRGLDEDNQLFLSL